VQLLGVDERVANGFHVLLSTDKAVFSGQVLVLGAARVRSVTAAQLVFEIDQVSGNVTHGRSTDDAELGSALVAVFELASVEGVRQRRHALRQLLHVRARVVCKPVHRVRNGIVLCIRSGSFRRSFTCIHLL